MNNPEFLFQAHRGHKCTRSSLSAEPVPAPAGSLGRCTSPDRPPQGCRSHGRTSYRGSARHARSSYGTLKNCSSLRLRTSGGASLSTTGSHGPVISAGEDGLEDTEDVEDGGLAEEEDLVGGLTGQGPIVSAGLKEPGTIYSTEPCHI